ncbi:MAG: hypothetical protein A3G23_01460 [Bacteroidetes bacterium RIFCSPLOWO2_12_FULL_37_12]|nr:MAG: hypothetical protein A3G23_01460 [Bacteroidetes bacterium RIFCSPLOWO2_12_FULL_37_12]
MPSGISQNGNIITKRIKYTGLIFFCAGVVVLGIIIKSTIDKFPIDHRISDIIPTIQKLVNRYLNGEFPYQTITDWGYNLYPTYLPFQWEQYILAEKINLDYRWFAFYGTVFCLIIYAMIILNRNQSILKLSILFCLPFLTIILLNSVHPKIFGVTVEILIASYYLLLVMSVYSKNIFAISITLILCLLSRYFILLWLPLFLYIFYFTEGFRKILVISVFCILGIILFYALPFLWKDPSIFLMGLQYHSYAALGEWSGQAWQAPGARPIALFQGIGFASFFYEYVGGSVAERLRTLQLIHFMLSCGAILFLSTIYFFIKKQVHHRLFIIGSLKIFLVFFYNFIQIPYAYLFLVPVFVSFGLISCVADATQSK